PCLSRPYGPRRRRRCVRRDSVGVETAGQVAEDDAAVGDGDAAVAGGFGLSLPEESAGGGVEGDGAGADGGEDDTVGVGHRSDDRGGEVVLPENRAVVGIERVDGADVVVLALD